MADATVRVREAEAGTAGAKLIDNEELTNGNGDTVYRQKVALGAMTGTWAYAAGTNGTEVITGRVLQITAIALGAAGTFTIDGGDTITIPYDATDKTSADITIKPMGNLVDPTIVFDSGVDSYFIEYVS